MAGEVRLFALQPAPQSPPLTRPRSRLGPEYVRFGPDSDGFEVFVAPAAMRGLHDATRRGAPREVFGLLAGRTFRDQQGHFTVVTQAARAAASDSSTGSVVVEASDLSALKARVEDEYPALEIVGWHHSHRSVSDFSRTDRAEQATWPSDDHVGLLTFMDDASAIRAYRGPRARPLRLASRHDHARRAASQPAVSQGFQLGLEQLPVGTATPATTVDTASRPERGPARRKAQARARWVALWLFTGVAVALGAITAYRLSGAVPRTRITDLSRWQCDSRTPSVVACDGPVGDGVIGWHWTMNDAVVATGPSVRHAVHGTERAKVRLVVTTVEGSSLAGERVVSVRPAAPTTTAGADTTRTPQRRAPSEPGIEAA